MAHTSTPSKGIRIFYQVFSASASVDPKWTWYEESSKAYIPTVARPGTEIHLTGTALRAPKMIYSKYVKHLHIEQVIENAVRAEREGYDAFVTGGMFDLGLQELREAVDIPVLGIAEACYYTACMMVQRFGVIHTDEWFVKVTGNLLKSYGIADRAVLGQYIEGWDPSSILKGFEERPEELIEAILKVSRKLIREGAELLIPDYAPTTIFLCQHGIHEVDGVPILNNTAALIKQTELQVDFRRMGLPKPKMGPHFALSKFEIEAARRVYGKG